jgi:hypothetical protein
VDEDHADASFGIWEQTRYAFAIIVIDGFDAPAVGMNEPSIA